MIHRHGALATADALVQATGGTGKVAILRDSSRNNVTNDRANAFVEHLAAKAPGAMIVAQQAGEFGPLAFQTALSFSGGTAVQPNIIISDRAYDAATAKGSLAGAC